MKLVNLEDSLVDELRDPKFAAAFLQAVLDDEDAAAFLLALRQVANANGGMGKLAKRIGVGRESLYKSLSKRGNPEFSKIEAILQSLGMRFAVVADKRKKRVA